ncbi:MAG TPA: protein kinase [Candidatus Hydrogenedentes bacterium]|nr:protein kinase [Candidatus Hydrogenedentota bacterium]
MEQDRNLLFGVLAVQLGKVSSSRLMQVAAAWAVDPAQSLEARLVDGGALSETDRDLIQRFVEEAIRAHAGDARATLDTFGGEERVLKTFGGTVPLPGSNKPPVVGQAPAGTTIPEDTGVLQVEGRYEFVSEQGRGGYGRVCLVRDVFMTREVAMKELIPPSDEPIGSNAATPSREAVEAVARFLQEARITGQLEHPSIVPVYELGHRADGSLYYTMKLVRGQTLNKEIAKRTTLRERLELLPRYLDLCHAIAYAHDRGVIHRDIKPDNVMIGSFGETVVIDWGLAKLKGRADVYASEIKETVRILQNESPSPTSQTLYGTILGTPHYMAPEQARGDIENVDERSDVYALGAVLYILLTGKRPYDKAPLQNVILHMNLPPLTPVLELAPGAPPELVAICTKALERQQANRYPNAAAIAEDVNRYLSGALVQAHEYTLRDQLRRFVRKHRAQVATAGIALATLLLVAIVSYVQILQANTRERQQRVAAENAEQLATEKGAQEAKARARAEHELYLSNVRLAHQSINENQIDLARTLLAACPPAHRNFEWGWLQQLCNEDLATLYGHAAPIRHVAISNDGKIAASGDATGLVILWDVLSGAELRRATIMEVPIHSIAFSPDAQSLVITGKQAKVVVCAVDSLDTAYSLEGHTSPVNGAAISPDGKLIATASSDDTVRVWSTETRETIATLTEHLNDAVAVAWSPDQSFLLTGALDNAALVWDTATWAVRARLNAHRNDITAVAVSRDGARIATGGSDSRVVIWNAATGAEIDARAFEADVRDVAFSATGHQLAVALAGPLAYLIDVDDSSGVAYPIRGHAAEVSAVAFAATGNLLVTASADRTLKLWYAPAHLAGPPRATSGVETQEIHVADNAFTRIAKASTDGTCTLYDVANRKVIGTIENLGHSGLGTRLWQFAPNSSSLLFTPDDNRPKIYDFAAAEQKELAITGSPFYPAISNDSTRVAISLSSGGIDIFDSKTAQLVKTLTAAKPGHHLLPVFSPDDKSLVVAFMDLQESDIALIDIESGASKWTAKYNGQVASTIFAQDGGEVIVSGSNGLLVLNAASGEIVPSPLAGPRIALNAIALSPDGNRLAADVPGAGIILYDVASGREILRLNRAVPFPPATPLQHGDLFFDAEGTALRYITTESQGRSTIVSLDATPWDDTKLPGDENTPIQERINVHNKLQRAARAERAIQWDDAYAWLAAETIRARARFAADATPQQDLFANPEIKEWDISPSQWTMLLQMGRNRLKNLRDTHGYRGMEISSDLVIDKSLAEFLSVLGFENNDIIVRINDSSTPGYDMFIEALESAHRQNAQQISVYFMRSGKAMVHHYYRTEPKPS